MATQAIHTLIVFVACYVVTGVLLIESAMYLMSRLDDPAASATARCPAVECQVGTTLLIQADLGRTYPPEGSIRKTIEVDEFSCPQTSDHLFPFSEEFQEPSYHDGLQPYGRTVSPLKLLSAGWHQYF